MSTSAPLDARSAAVLAADGLRLALVDTGDEAAFDDWLTADVRGFHSAASPAEYARMRDALAYRRTTAVYDDAALDARIPIATVNSWLGELTVPGRRVVPAWEISSVTVSPTHRGRGIARALLEAELRTAVAEGASAAVLTVSESTLYGRYGFGPAAFAADWRIDTSRVTWSGPRPGGRVHAIDVARYLREAPELYRSVRLEHPGQVELWPARWAQQAAIGDDETAARRVRALRYDDESGEPRGFAIYDVTGGDDDFTAHTATLRQLVAADRDAYAALWRYVLQLPLVRTVEARLRAVDEPVRWMLGDWRAARVAHYDHLWLRLLDAPAFFAGRAAGADGVATLRIDDPLGFVHGAWRLEAVDGVLRAERADESAGAAIELDAAAAGSLALGGVSASELVHAGRATPTTDDATAIVDRMLGSQRTPWLGSWF